MTGSVLLPAVFAGALAVAALRAPDDGAPKAGAAIKALPCELGNMQDFFSLKSFCLTIMPSPIAKCGY